MATKAARIFFSLIGKSYLKRMILAFVAYVTCEIGKGNSYEVLPLAFTYFSTASNDFGFIGRPCEDEYNG
jgi:hypothetical protein